MKLIQLFLLIILGYTSVHAGRSYSQHKQDIYLLKHFFPKKRSGFFVELGAYDGVSISNTYFFEKYRDWSGICIEPMAEPYEKLVQNRQCICLNRCVSDRIETVHFFRIHVDEKQKNKDKKAHWREMLSGVEKEYDSPHRCRIQSLMDENKISREKISMQTTTLQSIFDEQQVTKIDLLSLDIEGGEYKILKSIDFSKMTIDVILVENNYYNKKIHQLLESKGYKFDKRIFNDEIYFLPKQFPSIKGI